MLMMMFGLRNFHRGGRTHKSARFDPHAVSIINHVVEPM